MAKIFKANEKEEIKDGKGETKTETSQEGLQIKEVHSVVRDWNSFVDSLLEAKRLWEKMNKDLPSRMEREIIFPYQAQLVFSMFENQEFTVMLPRFVDYFRGYGGLEVMKS